MTAPDDLEAVVAATTDLVGRTGAAEFEFGWLNDYAGSEEGHPVPDPYDPGWWARARYGGTLVVVENHRTVGAACEALAERLLNGGQCRHCLRPISIAGAGAERCSWRRSGPRWVRGCEAEFPDRPPGTPRPTKERLALVLAQAGCPGSMVLAAARGYYDDYESPHWNNIHVLAADLRKLGLEKLAQRAMDGEFDGTKEESDAWARSPDGQRAAAELLGGNRKQRRARRRQ